MMLDKDGFISFWSGFGVLTRLGEYFPGCMSTSHGCYIVSFFVSPMDGISKDSILEDTKRRKTEHAE